MSPEESPFHRSNLPDDPGSPNNRAPDLTSGPHFNQKMMAGRAVGFFVSTVRGLEAEREWLARPFNSFQTVSLKLPASTKQYFANSCEYLGSFGRVINKSQAGPGRSGLQCLSGKCPDGSFRCHFHL